MADSQLERLRGLVLQYIDKHQYESALFWADKVASLSHFQQCDVYCLAQCMYYLKQYERAALLITRRKLHLKQYAFRYLAAKCYTSSKDWQVALDLLDIQTKYPSNNLSKKLSLDPEKVDGVPEDKDMVASIHLLKGDIYEAMEIREIAADCYKDALKADVFCYEAFDHLVGHHMLRADEEQDLLDSLPFHKQCKTAEDQQLVQFLYNIKLKKYDKPGQFNVPSNFENLHDNLDVAASLAERHYYNCEFQTSFNISTGILKIDPYHSTCLPLHVALLVELEETNKLFYLAHQLVGRYPELPVSWYAVGCYYFLQKKQDLARRYLLKTTLLDKMYGPAWLAYGHSFASENEHDQAMAAYFTASQLMRGCHLPFLYIGLEYSVTNNTKLAEKFFSTALEISPDDPHVLHEMGVASYANKDYPKALNYFTSALEQIQGLGQEVTIEEWEPLLNNLGHVNRKLRNYSQSLEFHRQALMLVPHSADTYTAIGYVYSFMGEYLEAIEYLHKSLGLRRDDAFTSSLLDTVVDQFAATDKPVYGGLDDLSLGDKEDSLMMECGEDWKKTRSARIREERQPVMQRLFSDSGDTPISKQGEKPSAANLPDLTLATPERTGVELFSSASGDGAPNLSTPVFGVTSFPSGFTAGDVSLLADGSDQGARIAWQDTTADDSSVTAGGSSSDARTASTSSTVQSIHESDLRASRSTVASSSSVPGRAGSSKARSFSGDVAFISDDDMDLDESLDT